MDYVPDYTRSQIRIKHKYANQIRMKIKASLICTKSLVPEFNHVSLIEDGDYVVWVNKL